LRSFGGGEAGWEGDPWVGAGGFAKGKKFGDADGNVFRASLLRAVAAALAKSDSREEIVE
jgi:hypothetical protein